MESKLILNDEMMILEEAFSRARKIFEGQSHVGFTAEEFMKFYGCAYRLCSRNDSNVNARAIYERYEVAMKDCIIHSVLPLLEGKPDVVMLTMLVQVLYRYKAMASRLSKIVVYVDRYFAPNLLLPPLRIVSLRCFHELVGGRFSNEFQAAARSLINQERNGEQSDGYLLRAVMEFFVEAKSVGATCYDDFEEAVLGDATAYYSQMASYGLHTCSYADYIDKAWMLINLENKRVCDFLDVSMGMKLLRVVRTELLDRVSVELREKQLAENSVMGINNQDLPIPPELENGLSALFMKANISSEPQVSPSGARQR